MYICRSEELYIYIQLDKQSQPGHSIVCSSMVGAVLEKGDSQSSHSCGTMCAPSEYHDRNVDWLDLLQFTLFVYMESTVLVIHFIYYTR